MALATRAASVAVPQTGIRKREGAVEGRTRGTSSGSAADLVAEGTKVAATNLEALTYCRLDVVGWGRLVSEEDADM